MAKLRQLLKEVEMTENVGNLDVNISGIEYNSQNVNKGSVFVAIKGFQRDGAEFIEEALEKGAVGVVLQEGTAMPNRIGDKTGAVVVKDSRKALASLSADFFGHPSRELDIVGITGTNGKTTIAYLLESILQSAGKKTGVIGTINYRFGGKVKPAMQTTPESLDLQKMFREMADNKVDNCFLEVSSHSLMLDRVYNTDFSVGVFTNLTQDHLDFHHTEEDYFKAKEKLFLEYKLKKAVVNVDDPYGKIISKKTSAETITIGIIEKSDVHARNIETSIKGIQFTAKTPQGEVQIVSGLLGRHNVYNILCAIATAIALGVSLEEIKRGIGDLQNVPGRLEKIDEGQDFTVVVDYAHTDDALKNVLKAARELTDKSLISVFGCGGNRDRGKRPKMGKIAGEYSDYTIITSDNPRNEEPASIASEIEQGIKKVAGSEKYSLILDRKKAIRQAIDMAEKEDFVVIAGKGHENYQLSKNLRIHFDDCETARELINEKLSMIN
tara:strand:+ start:7285 stop:8772 length:1488 start_codon:yes stop_codon:yes gene_type:complete